MKTEAQIQAIDDLKEVCRAIREKRPVDPVVAARVIERSDEVIRFLDSQPQTNIAVDLIREVRDR